MTTELPLLDTPAHGIPDVVDTPEDFSCACTRLAAATGPVAIDAERASGIRYGQRAFLVQLRRDGAGTFLLDAETLGGLSDLNAAVGHDEWVIHSVTQDLPCLQDKGMKPAAVFDTELAARLLGWEKFGLAAVAERTLGVRLAKEHSAADWSTRPLPDEWLSYAALDVEVLLPIRDILHQELLDAGRWEYARQEFAHLLDFRPRHYDEPWRRTRGLSKLKSRRDIARVRELWQARDGMAYEADIAPTRVLRDRELIALAQSGVKSSDDILRTWRRLSRSEAGRLFRAVRKASRLPAEELPPRHETDRRARSEFDRAELKERVAALKSAMAELSQTLSIPHDVLLQPALVKTLAAQPRIDVADYLAGVGAREWQIELSAPVLTATLEALPRA